MATTITQAFAEFKSNLEITDRQESLVAERHSRVLAALTEDLILQSPKSVVTGSWARNTLTRYLSEGDVDVMIILDDIYKVWDYPDGTISALDRFRKVLDEAYPATPKRRDRNCITLQFSEFRLDVVPAIKYESDMYAIPDSVDGIWRRTNPSAFGKLISQVNESMGGTFVPLIKMVKGWNREAGWPIRSFHLENLLYQHHQTTYLAFSYPYLLYEFFQELPELLASPCYESITWDRVDTYLDNTATVTRRQIAIEKAQAAARMSEEAYDDQDEFPAVAIGEWKHLMGRFFPSFG